VSLPGATGFIDGPKLAKLPQWQRASIIAMVRFGEVEIALSTEQLAIALGVPLRKVSHAISLRRVRGAQFTP
jgi:hypothetical protein